MIVDADRGAFSPGQAKVLLDALVEFGRDSQLRLVSRQEPDGLNQTSLGRADDRHFFMGRWRRDHVLAVLSTFNPDWRKHFRKLNNPEYAKRNGPGKTDDEFCQATLTRLLDLQWEPEQMRRLQSRPGDEDLVDTMYRLKGGNLPCVRYDRYPKSGGLRVHRLWGHDQIDSMASELTGNAIAIQKGMDILSSPRGSDKPRAVALEETALHLNEGKIMERSCIGVWEQGYARIPWYSAKVALLAQLHLRREGVLETIHDHLRFAGRQPRLTRQKLDDSIGQLIWQVPKLLNGEINGIPGNFSTRWGHDGVDASILLLLPGQNLSWSELQVALEHRKKLKTKDGPNGEKRKGYYRFQGDDWQRGVLEPGSWTLLNAYTSEYDFEQASQAFQDGRVEEGDAFVGSGWSDMSEVIELNEEHGYVPEILRDLVGNGSQKPNDNELAWFRGAVRGSCAKGISAILAQLQAHNAMSRLSH